MAPEGGPCSQKSEALTEAYEGKRKGLHTGGAGESKGGGGEGSKRGPKPKGKIQKKNTRILFSSQGFLHPNHSETMVSRPPCIKF